MARKISRWTCTQKETFRRYIAFRVKDSNPVEYIALDGCTFAMQVRSKEGATGPAEAEAVIEITTDDLTTPEGDTIPAGSAAYIEIDSTQTTALKGATTHKFDVFRTNADGTVDTVAAGDFYVYARVTIIE